MILVMKQHKTTITDHYSKILNLETPWFVSDTNLDTDNVTLKIHVSTPRGVKLPCPQCGKLCSKEDHRQKREWRHLDTMQFQTLIVCCIPRVNCPEHGVISVEVPWSDEYSRFTQLFEKFAIDVLKATQTISAAMKLLNISWTSIQTIAERAVDRGLVRREQSKTQHVGVDEKSFLRGHSYVSVLTDIDKEYFQTVKTEELKVGKAWSIKEALRPFWEFDDVRSARKYFNKWYYWATHSRLAPLIKVVKTLKKHLEGILGYIVHKVTNATAEGLNSKIQSIKASARGFRSFKNYRIAILFHCGKLDLYP